MQSEDQLLSRIRTIKLGKVTQLSQVLHGNMIGKELRSFICARIWLLFVSWDRKSTSELFQFFSNFIIIMLKGPISLFTHLKSKN